MKNKIFAIVCLMLSGMVLTHSVNAQEASTDELAKAAQNPLATMVTLPLQANFNNNVGPFERRFFNLNVQPVVPIKGEKWNLITRTILPVNSAPQGEFDSTFGLGDTSLQLFFSPASSGKLTWGVGPVFLLPTASDPQNLGSEKWGVGPAGVLFYATGKWTMGGVISNIWSFAGESDRADVNLLTLQYFVNYNMGNGWAVGTAPVISANWEADSDNTWTIPWGLQVSKVTKIANQPVNLLLGYYANSEEPTGASDEQVRFQINFLFPTG